MSKILSVERLGLVGETVIYESSQSLEETAKLVSYNYTNTEPKSFSEAAMKIRVYPIHSTVLKLEVSSFRRYGFRAYPTAHINTMINHEQGLAHIQCKTSLNRGVWLWRCGAAAIVVATRSGFTARAVARHRPRLPVIALAPDDAVRHRLSLVWGITALYMKWEESPEILLARFREPVRAAGLLAPGARVVVTAGWPSGEVKKATVKVNSLGAVLAKSRNERSTAPA